MAATPSTMLALGTEAPAFELPDPNGALHSLDAVAGDAPALVVAFLSNHCPYVKHIGRELGLVTQKLLAKGVAVVGIMSNDVDAYPDDAPPLMATTARSYGWDFPYLYDETQDVARSYSAACTPDFFVFDKSGPDLVRGADVLTDTAEMRARIFAAKAPDGAWEAKIGPGRLQDIELLAQACALRAADPARRTEAQLRAGLRAGLIGREDEAALQAAYRFFWRLQAGGRLLSDKPIDMQAIGEGGRSFLLRETGMASLEALASELGAHVARTSEIVARGLGQDVVRA